LFIGDTPNNTIRLTTANVCTTTFNLCLVVLVVFAGTAFQ